MKEPLKSISSGIINSISAGILAVDKEGRILQYNNSVTKVLQTHSEPSSKPENIHFYIAFPPLEKCVPYFQKIISSESEFEEINIINDDRTYHVIITPLKSEELCGAVITLNDVTEALKAQDNLIRVQKMETVSTMVGGLAHDFNNTLTGISASVSYLSQFVINEEQPDIGEIKETMQIIEGAVNQASGMVNQLLTFSMKKKTEPVPVDIVSIIHHALNVTRRLFDKRIEFEVNLPKTPSIVMADPDQLEQVIFNILINAGHAMTIMRSKGETHEGILSINFEPSAQIEDLSFISHEKKILQYRKLTISDTGVGMDKETQQKIFEPFYTTKHSGKGKGLGLAMVYGIVRKLKGEIDIHSIPGEGTVFNIYIPGKDQEISEKSIDSDYAEKRNTKPDLKGQATILIAEDESILRMAISKSLSACGFTVFSTENGKNAVACYKENYKDIDLVILDMIKPEITGDATYKHIKKINPNVKVLLTSGFKKDEQEEKVLESGISYFMQKPYFKDDLLLYISEILKEDKGKE